MAGSTSASLPRIGLRWDLSASEITALAKVIIKRSTDIQDSIAKLSEDARTFESVVVPLAEFEGPFCFIV
jgi:hypothetical protein